MVEGQCKDQSGEEEEQGQGAESDEEGVEEIKSRRKAKNVGMSVYMEVEGHGDEEYEVVAGKRHATKEGQQDESDEEESPEEEELPAPRRKDAISNITAQSSFLSKVEVGIEVQERGGGAAAAQEG